jgi:hypothetical protein
MTPGQPHRGALDKRILNVCAVVILGPFISSRDTTIVSAALAALGRDLHRPLSMIQSVTATDLMGLAVVSTNEGLGNGVFRRNVAVARTSRTAWRWVCPTPSAGIDKPMPRSIMPGPHGGDHGPHAHAVR